MYKVLITDPLSEQGIYQLLEAEDVEVKRKPGLTGEELFSAIETADALLVRSQTKVTAELIEKASRLKVIARAGVGVDNIDVPAATKKGIIVVNAPDGNTISTAEHTFAMLIALARNIPQAYRSVISGEWNRKNFVGVELNQKTLSIIGLGRIGTELAKRAKAFRMNVVAFDPYLSDERAAKIGVKKATFEEAIAAGDFITVHTPLTKETRHLINKETFSLMKDGVRILNCARGGIIDEEALYDAIQSGKVAGAALDVFENEPPGEHPLFSLPQVIATPHLGASTLEAQENVAVDVCEEVLHILRGEPFKNAVNLPSIPAELQQKLAPYQELAEKLGKFISQVASGALTKITVTYSGEVAELEVAPLTRTILKGVLSHHLTDVNYVNAPHLAKQRGIQVVEQKTANTHGFTQLIKVEVVTATDIRSVAGTLLNGFGSRITKIDDYPVDVTPQGHLVFVQHRDQPGAIGRVGTLLGSHDINIATMQVGRQAIGGQAIMVLRIDKPLPQSLIASLQELKEIQSLIEIDL
ncbi:MULTISPECIES: phosphoglycerate dehydrogenase [Thermoactinomyces]|jgi:D-3-phosphoglycerate dehydrogenase|uniref:D-3-phosphoglycerate dehydrogenase n=1 Tax=Thermoactinomyces daqus TaxID=1329516 RepID=A0A7W2AHU7_9BACL|nr:MULTISPECIES: phosphoglycerate dehydrogenase [Thermoactinomyces]MBA4543106.1 phosphoglycerate dehydrogenase [Thermoactinomyces daqus]MBH8596659.1 phosphoglycerate dehydrogenase [Thermoactinomyces sp. CICC 10523]MBH8607812.1 phosphoglycerate dehydrogenase [Thermoactinomyces sp. CICC 10521]